jgi:hypothetical protein
LTKNVKPQRFLKDQSFVLDFNEPLIDRRDLAQVQLSHEASLIDAFDQTRALQAVNLDSRADGNVAQLISPLEKWMHGNDLHEGNEVNEDFVSHLSRYIISISPTRAFFLNGEKSRRGRERAQRNNKNAGI